MDDVPLCTAHRHVTRQGTWSSRRPAALALSVLLCQPLAAQPAGAANPLAAGSGALPETQADGEPRRPVPRVERLVVEDVAVRIDELRVGGRSQRIRVSPKGELPGYDLAPEGGRRVWNLLQF